MKDRILVYEKNRYTIAFLKAFFKQSNSYSATFITSLDDLKKKLKRRLPYALVTGAPECLDRIAKLKPKCPVVALVSKDITGGMRSVVRNDIHTYLIEPFSHNDLEHKLNSAHARVGFLEALCPERKDLETLSSLTYKLSSTLDPKEVLYIIVKQISELIPVTRCSILSINFGAEDKYAKVVSTHEDSSIERITLDIKKYPEIEAALNTRSAIVVKDAMKDPIMTKVREIIRPLGIKSIAVIPIIFRDEVIGTLFLRTSRKKYNFTDREIRLCQGIATASAMALNNAFLFEKVKAEKAELQKLSITDFLTGVYNIRYFYHRIADEFDRAQRYETKLSCMMMDIDYFKSINDTYGHRTGDMVLREFARLIQQHTRKSDVFARYGGEEFILLLPHTDAKGAMMEAKRLSRLIKNHRFFGIKASTRITVSIGIAMHPHKEILSQDDLINLADDALMQAKKSGRNKVLIDK